MPFQARSKGSAHKLFQSTNSPWGCSPGTLETWRWKISRRMTSRNSWDICVPTTSPTGRMAGTNPCRQHPSIDTGSRFDPSSNGAKRSTAFRDQTRTSRCHHSQTKRSSRSSSRVLVPLFIGPSPAKKHSRNR